MSSFFPLFRLLVLALLLTGCIRTVYTPEMPPTAPVPSQPLPVQKQTDHPRLIPDESVGPDLAGLAQETWVQFLAVFARRTACFGDVGLHAEYSLNSRASYDPVTATATILVPGTPAMLQSGLIHEWAHHLEFQCPAQAELRPAFLAAQGLPTNTEWQPGGARADLPASEWAKIPSEQYAETVIEVVLGSRPIPTTAEVSPEAVRVVRAWADCEERYACR